MSGSWSSARRRRGAGRGRRRRSSSGCRRRRRRRPGSRPGRRPGRRVDVGGSAAMRGRRRRRSGSAVASASDGVAGSTTGGRRRVQRGGAARRPRLAGVGRGVGRRPAELQPEAAGEGDAGGQVGGGVDVAAAGTSTTADPSGGDGVLDPGPRPGARQHRQRRLVGLDGDVAERHDPHAAVPRQARRTGRRRTRRPTVAEASACSSPPCGAGDERVDERRRRGRPTNSSAVGAPGHQPGARGQPQRHVSRRSRTGSSPPHRSAATTRGGVVPAAGPVGLLDEPLGGLPARRPTTAPGGSGRRRAGGGRRRCTAGGGRRTAPGRRARRSAGPRARGR